MTRCFLLLITVGLCLVPDLASAHPPRVGIGIGFNFGPPAYYGRPYYGYGYPRYYYAPPPVVYAPAPIYVQPAPVYVQPQIVPVPAVSAAPGATAPPAVASTPPPLVHANHQGDNARVDQLMQQLQQADERTRRDAAMDLGRMRAQNAIGALIGLLQRDSSPAVREAAARGLGLIGSAQSLNALTYAAQADQDRDVRHSAQFAIEVIRANLR